MSKTTTVDWDPTAESVLSDQVTAYDDLRRRCPVAHSELLGWSVFGHSDVSEVLADPQTFSSVVSKHSSVPNGMDPPEHSHYRQALEPFFTTDKLQSFEPLCRQIADDLLTPLASGNEFDFIEAFAIPFASRCQCAFLGWPHALAKPVQNWTRKNREAILANDRLALAEIALEFESFVATLLEERHGAHVTPPNDITTALQQTRVNGNPLTRQELTSVLRNWTVGEVGSMAAAVGILARHLAKDPPLQLRLRNEPALLPVAIEEILRVEGPLVSNRRRATRDVTLGGRHIGAGERVSVMWVSANRDEQVFDDARTVRLDRKQDPNLLWGAGIHACPGADLARLEMRIALEQLLMASSKFVIGKGLPLRLLYPENGWASLPLRLP